MGRDRHEEAKRGAGKETPPRKGTNNLVSYRPSEEEIASLRDNPPTWVKIWDGLGKWMAHGFKLSTGMNLENGSFYAILREPGADWKTARAVGVWSASPGKALMCIYYYLEYVNSTFPEGAPVVEDHIVDW